MKLIYNTGKVSLTWVTALLLASICSVASFAAGVVDPANDFLPTYTGPKNGDLDALTANVTLNGSVFDFRATLNGKVGETSGAVYVFGIDRGRGTPKFANIGNPGVIFDSTFTIDPSGGSVVKDLINHTSTVIASITISGATISGVVPVSYLPSEGFGLSSYRYALWPTFATRNVMNSGIADFAPNNATALVSATPEPGAASMIGVAGLLLLAGIRRRKLASTGLKKRLSHESL